MISPVNIYRRTTYPVKLVELFRQEWISKKYTQILRQKSELESCKATIFKYISEKQLRFKQLRTLTKSLKRNEEITVLVPDAELNELCKRYNKIQIFLKDSLLLFDNRIKELEIKEREDLQKKYTNTRLSKSLDFTIGDSVQRKLKDYVDSTVASHNKNLRKLDRLLIEYLTRATLKTSPLADLTRTTITGDKSNQSKFQKVTINNYFLLELLSRVVERNLIRCNLQYRTNKTAVEKKNKMYVTIPENNHDSKSKVYLLNNAQGLKTIKLSNTLKKILESTTKWKNLTEILHLISKITGVNKNEATLLVRKLINNGFLVSKSIVDTTQTNFLSQFHEFLEEKNIERELREDLLLLHKNISEMSSSEDIEDKKLKNVIKKLRVIEEKYSMTHLPDKNLIYVDFGGGNSRNIKDLKEYKNDFEHYQELSLLFDSAFRSRIQVSDEVKKNFGKNPKIKNEVERSKIFRFIGNKLANSKQTDIYAGVYDWNKNEDNSHLNSINRQVISLFKYLKRNSEKHSIYIPEELLEKNKMILKQLITNEKISHSLFAQEINNNQLVINHLYRGFTSFISRFSKDFPKNMQYQQYVDEQLNNVYEFPYSYGFNANIHKHYLNKTIKLPYDSTDTKGIGWEDLEIQIDDTTGLLGFRYKGEKILPLFIGSLIKMLCPPIQNIIDLMGSHGAMYFDLGDIYFHQRLQDETDEIIHNPRVNIGNSESSITISREKWLIPTKELVENKTIEQQKYFLDYFLKRSLPTTFFVRGFAKNVGDIKGNNAKPQYINLSSPTLVKTFSHIIRQNEYVCVEEEFPKIGKKAEYCEEYIIENTFEE